MSKKIITAQNAPAAIGPYNHAVVAGGMLYASGQIAIEPMTGKLITSNIQEETRQVLRNVSAILRTAALNFEDVVKCTVFVKNMGDYAEINEAYATFFNEDTAPARELVEVRNLPADANIEISVIAVVKES